MTSDAIRNLSDLELDLISGGDNTANITVKGTCSPIPTSVVEQQVKGSEGLQDWIAGYFGAVVGAIIFRAKILPCIRNALDP